MSEPTLSTPQAEAEMPGPFLDEIIREKVEAALIAYGIIQIDEDDED